MPVNRSTRLSGTTQIWDINEKKLDIFNSFELKEALLRELESGNRNVVLNLSSVDYMDSSGLGCVISVSLRAEDLDGKLGVYGLSEYVNNLFELNQLSDHINIYKTESDAVAGTRG